jgi:hypothetical protein
MTRRTLAAAALVVALIGAVAFFVLSSGAPEELNSDDDEQLAEAREGMDDALDTEETIRTSPEMARALRRSVARIDDPERLARVVPSLVVDGEIDKAAAGVFLRHATSDPAKALLPPAQRAMNEIVGVIDASDANGDTKVPHAGDRPLDRYASEIERDIRDVWPALAKQLEDAL